jgi:hypothetical protein
MEVVKSFVDPLVDMDLTFKQAREEAKSVGATKMVILVLKDADGWYQSRSFKTENIKYSECVALLEIQKNNILKKMDGL